MPDSLPITALEIIAYATRLTDTMLPAIVPPVFRQKKGASDRVLLPPFTIRDGMLHNATVATPQELNALDDAGEATLLNQPLDARPDHELWVKLDRGVRYEPIREASANLRALAKERIDLARTALVKGDLGAAEDHCRIALSADDRLMEPLAINAAIARRRNRKGEERLMGTLAQDYLTDSGFQDLVNGFARLIEDKPATTEDLFADHPMKGMAAIRPESSQAA